MSWLKKTPPKTRKARLDPLNPERSAAVTRCAEDYIQSIEGTTRAIEELDTKLQALERSFIKIPHDLKWAQGEMAMNMGVQNLGLSAFGFILELMKDQAVPMTPAETGHAAARLQSMLAKSVPLVLKLLDKNAGELERASEAFAEIAITDSQKPLVEEFIALAAEKAALMRTERDSIQASMKLASPNFKALS